MNKTAIKLLIIGLLSPMIVWAADEAVLSASLHIRSLAASCAACHGTMGNAVLSKAGKPGEPGVIVPLAGMDQAMFVNKLLAFKSGALQATVMHRHAKGLADEEIAALAKYFASQPPQSSSPLISQKLQADHAN